MIRVWASSGMVAFALFAGSCVPPLPPAAAAPPPPKSPLLRPEMSGGGPAIVPAPTPEPTATISGITLIGTPMQGAIVQGIAPRGVLNLTLDGAPVRVAPDGVFIIGFGRDAPPRSVLRATSPQVRAIEVPLTVAPRAWQIETIASVPRFAQPSAEFARLRGPELAQINAARRIDAASDGWRQHFIWPVTGRISGLFGSQRVYANGEKGDPHSGVDIARPAGTPVVSPADGVVILAADHPFTLEGNLLMIDHGMGLNSAFLHLSRIDVKVGDRVRQGQPVGAIGMTGRASGPHLHWSMKWQDRRVDPLLVAGPMG